jgi:gliding motility-associated-like protein
MKLLKGSFSKLIKILCLLIAFIPSVISATHIVGGELNYIYNGGSNYTIILRLYRDCGASTAAFPNSVAISVRGNNGVAFSPSKDFNMSLASVSNVPSNQPPCAVQPSPSPCTQVGTYSITVNNLPPNFGGYHLFYQVTARNLSLTNINGSCNCIGESFYAYIPNNSTSSLNNNNAVFNNLPPLFLCVNNPFTFNHSASDADGDSLVYSLYTPYNGDNGIGPLDPTFPSNTASFTPVNYLAGFTANNPLGASAFSINPVTGLLSGIPGMIGQFVVGVRVKEYRNSVYISQTLRDFQFNVINCPAPPPSLAIANTTINNGCIKTVTAGGITQASASWTSIFPGSPGTYNTYLSCTSACLTNTIASIGTPPPYIDFKVCGSSTNCAATNICDTFRVYFNPTLSVTIVPSNPVLCLSQTSTTLMALGSGGTPGYSYLWNNTNPSQIITVGSGVYNVALSDASGCPPVFKSVTVSTYTTPIVANAGPNIYKCVQTPIATINSTVSGASGGIWSGGTGTFSPNNTTLNNLNYIPTATEIATGSVSLILTTTGNGACPPDLDTMIIFFQNFTGSFNFSVSPVSCFGGNNGSATVNITGGAAPHQYTWTSVPVQTTSIANSLTAGSYSVSVTNSIGCVSIASVQINQPLPISLNTTLSNVSCFSASNASILTSAIGGNGSYTYSWTPTISASSSITNISAGNYTVKVTDSKGCQLSNTFTIIQPSSLTISSSITNIACYNGNNGAISNTISGGTSPYSYTWFPSMSTALNLANSIAGNYTFVVSDSKGCLLSKTFTITQPAALTATVNSLNETCNYSNNGSATITISGGTPGYTSVINPGNFTTTTVPNLPAGNYTASIIDSKGCSTLSNFIITQPPVLAAGLINQINVACFGGNTGKVTANPSGGTPGYSYLWTPIASTSVTAANLFAGTYTLQVTDSKSCTATATVLITQPNALNVVTSFTNLLCNASSNGAISINASGGVGPYTNTLMPGNIVNSNFSNLPAGNYTINSSDANGCTATNTVSISQPANFSSATSFTNSTCNTSNGAASVSITSGGVPPFTYTWLPSGGNSPLASNLSAGSYTAYVTDNNGCMSNHLINVNDVAGANVSIVSTTNVSCFSYSNGAATASFTGGTGPIFTYSWSPVGGNNLNANNLPAGTYVIKITDSNGCIGLATTTMITQPTQITSVVTKTNVTCFSNSNGSANVTVSGGTPNYSYLWTPGSYTTASVSNLAPTVYTVTITDNNNCISNNSVIIAQPALLTGTINSQSNVSCFGGNNASVSVNFSGGTPSYNYSWTPSIGNGPSLSNLSAGSYSLNVSDNNGCISTLSVTIIQPAAALTANAITSSVSCFGFSNGTASVQVSGGTPNYTYQWSPNISTASVATGLNIGSYQVQITDTKGCQTQTAFQIMQPPALISSLTFTNPSCGNSNGAISIQISGGIGPYIYSWIPATLNVSTIYSLAPGSYTTIITDAVNCTNTISSALLNISGPTTSISNKTNISCFGMNNGTASVNISSGTSPFSIQWLPFGGNSSVSNSLSVGVYSVTVTDQNNCVSTATTSITQPPALSVGSIISKALTCFQSNDGSIAATLIGGTPGYTYSWAPAGSTNSLINVAAGNYTLVVKDANNCSVTAGATVSQPTLLNSSVTAILNAPCYNADGSASISVNGGTIPYNYQWSTGTQNGNVITNVPSGTYSVLITDANGCTATNSLFISQPSQVKTFATTNSTICAGQNATVAASAQGGVGNYNYQWMPLNMFNNGIIVTMPTINTIYTVMAFDQNGCSGISAISKIYVLQFFKSNMASTGISPICPGQVSLLSSTVTGNTGNVKYTWFTPNTGTALSYFSGPVIVSPTVQTNYIVKATNECGIDLFDTVTIDLIPQPTISFVSDTNEVCMPGTIEFTDLSMPGNNNDPITSWEWYMGAGQYSTESHPIFTYTSSGTFSVILKVSTDNGCTNQNANTPFLVTIFDKPKASFNVNSHVLDLPFDKLLCTNTSIGGKLYSWDFGDGNTSNEIHPEHLFNTIGDNIVQLITINDHGCSDTAQAIINTRADVVFPNAFTPNPAGGDGFYNIHALNNDVFFPYTSGVVEYKLQVFNRWGELIFESTDVNFGWDGRYRGEICEVGVYIFKAYVKLNNGRIYKKTGDLTLIK